MADTNPPRRDEEIEILPIGDSAMATTFIKGKVVSQGSGNTYGSNRYWNVKECGRGGETHPAFKLPASVRMGDCGNSQATDVWFVIANANYKNKSFQVAHDIRTNDPGGRPMA